MRTLKKRRLACSACAAIVWRAMKLPRLTCRKCRNKQTNKRRAGDRAAYNAKNKKWRMANQEKVLAINKRWRDAHPVLAKLYNKRARRNYAAKEKRLNKEVLDSLPCLECGVSHNQDRRLAVIARVLPSESEEIREAWPCFWLEDAGYQRLLRDLKAMGAELRGRLWMPARRAA